MPINYREESKEVLFSTSALNGFDADDIMQLKGLAKKNNSKKIRICAHQNTEEALHEMLIVHDYGAYIRPHRHFAKSESIHIIEGMADLIIFNEDGAVLQCLRLGDYMSGNLFYFRMASPQFHTLLIRSPTLVFHETTNGPFDRAETEFAPWSPGAAKEIEIAVFIKTLEEKIKLS